MIRSMLLGALSWRGFLTLATGIGGLTLLCWWFGFEELAHALAGASPPYLLLCLGCGVLVRLGHGARWGFVTRALGSRVDFKRLVAARLAGDAVGSLVPSAKLAGDPVRAALLYARGVRGSKASAGVAVDRLIEVIGNIVCGAAYISIFAATQAFGASRRAGLAAAASMLALLCALVVLLAMMRRGVRPFALLYGAGARRVAPRLGALTRALRQTEDHVGRLLEDRPATLMLGLLGSLCIELAVIAEYHSLLRGFGVRIDLPVLLIALVGTGMARAAPVPAGLGAIEAGQVAVLGFAAGRPELGFVAGVVMRLHETFWTAIGLAALSAEGAPGLAGRSAPPDGGAAA